MSRIVARLLEVTSGTVRLGSVPIADIPLAELRRRVAVVPQEVQLYQGSLRDNITLFRDDNDERYTVEAVRRTLIDVGLGHLLGGEGAIDPAANRAGDGTAGLHRSVFDADIGLSAGESQLLALARVWLRRPDLVVLDEATARIDPRTERIVGQAIRELLAGRTSIVIAHRLSTLQQVDDIAVFDHGRLVEFGPRIDLEQRQGGHYRRLLDFAAADLTEDGDFDTASNSHAEGAVGVDSSGAGSR